MSALEDLCVKLGVNFCVRIVYWDDEEPADRKAPWHLTVRWYGAPLRARAAWERVNAQERIVCDRWMMVADVFGDSLDAAVTAALLQPALQAAADAPDRIIGWTPNHQHDRLDPVLEF